MRLTLFAALLAPSIAFGGWPDPASMCSPDEPAWFSTIERRFGLSWRFYTRHVQPVLCSTGPEHRGHRVTTGYVVVGDLDACASTDSDGLCITGTDDIGAQVAP